MKEEEICIIWIFYGYTGYKKNCLSLSESKLSSWCLIVVMVFLESSKTLWTTWIENIFCLWSDEKHFSLFQVVSLWIKPKVVVRQLPGEDTDLQLALWSRAQHFISFSSVLVPHNYWRNCLSLSLLHAPLCSPAALLLSCLPFGAGQWVLTEMAAENHLITVWKQPETKHITAIVQLNNGLELHIELCR